MSKKYDAQSRSHAVGVTTTSILAVMFAMGLYVLADFGTNGAAGTSAVAASATKPVA